MIAIGIGYSTSCGAAEIVALIDRVCALHSVDASEARLIATVPERAGGAQLIEAAERLGLALVIPPAARLRAAAPFCLSRSMRVRDRFDLPSVAEAAALAAMADARLLGPRISSARATCALAATRPRLRSDAQAEAPS